MGQDVCRKDLNFQGYTSDKKPGSKKIKNQPDSDWRQWLKIGEPRRKLIFADQIAADAVFLAKMKIMDYSLLVGVHGRDPLQVPGYVPPKDRGSEDDEDDEDVDEDDEDDEFMEDEDNDADALADAYNYHEEDSFEESSSQQDGSSESGGGESKTSGKGGGSSGVVASSQSVLRRGGIGHEDWLKNDGEPTTTTTTATATTTCLYLCQHFFLSQGCLSPFHTSFFLFFSSLFISFYFFISFLFLKLFHLFLFKNSTNCSVKNSQNKNIKFSTKVSTYTMILSSK